jgi:Zn-dependent peptidase ImmA (M78 family)/DNA-binding XRE family transcriptional regulator
LALARQRRGLTKAKLAAAAGVTSRSVTAYESGETIPTEETTEALSEALGFPIEFFFGDEIDAPHFEATSFRARTSLTASRRDAALAAAALATEIADWLDERFLLPKCDVPDLSSLAPEEAAAVLRTRWGLGELPIKNTVHLLESRGVRVFSLTEECRKLDAFAFWRDTTPYVFLNTLKSGERGRFDAMHELGHLVLHRRGFPEGRTAEQEADNFAAAILMPRGDVLARAPRTPTLASLIQSKKRWNVSLAALTYRLHSLQLLTEWQYRTLCIHIAEAGYRRREPQPALRETSQVLKKAFDMLKEEGVSRSSVANELRIPVRELEALIFGLVIVGVPGGNPRPPSSTSKARLRLVHSR